MSNNQPRALVVAPTPTWPLDYGNRKRIFMVCKELKAKGFEIHYVHYASEGDWRNNMPLKTRQEMDKQWDIVDHIYPSVGLHDWPKHGEDHLIDEWWDPVLENHLQHLFKGRTYDVVIVNYTWLSKALDFVPTHTYKVLDTHDKFSGRRQLLAENGIDKEFFHTTEPEEIKGLSRADLVWAIKDEERILFEAMGVDAKVETLIHMDQQRPSLSPRNNVGYASFGFIGARNNINKVNIKNFLEAAIPIFEKYLPPLKIHIAGSICKELDNQENSFVKLLGYVDTVDSFYDNIDAAIVPMEFSTGLKIKAGEALSQSKPLLSHIHAMEGYPTTHSLHECKSFEEIALAMCELAYDFSGFDALSEATLSACNDCTDSIQVSIDNLEKYVESNRNIIFILPEQYGDEQSPIHWLCLSHIEWLSWRFNPIYVSLHQEYFGYHDPRVRYVSKSELQTLITARENSVIYNLDENLPKFELSESNKVIDMVSSGRDQSLSFIEVISKQTIPAFGHIKMPKYSALNLGKREGLIVLSSSTNSCILESFTRLSQFDSDERVEFFNLSNFDSLTVCLKNYIEKISAMPRKVVVAKNLEHLLPIEQIFIDFMQAHNVTIQFLGLLTEIQHTTCEGQSTSITQEKYDAYFYDKWLQAEKNIRKA